MSKKPSMAEMIPPLHAWLLGQCHGWTGRCEMPDIPYDVGIQTVRNALERMCKRGYCERKQDGSSVLYKATAKGGAARADAIRYLRWACADDPR